MKRDDFREELAASGYHVFHGVSDRMEYSNLIARIGRAIPQYNGESMFDVSKDDEKSNIYYSKGSGSIPPHTDGHDLLTPPQFLLLYCVRASQNDDGATEVSDFRRIHREIEPETRKILETRPYIFQSKPQDQEGESRALVPIHSPIYDPGRPIYRYSTNYIARQSSDNDTKKLVADIGNLHAQLKISIALKRGDVLVVNNHHMLHSRTEFSDPNRLLVRAWATTA